MRLCGNSRNKPNLLLAEGPKDRQIFLQLFSFKSILPVRLKTDTGDSCRLKGTRRADLFYDRLLAA